MTSKLHKKKEDLRPKMMVRITLTPNMQSDCLKELSDHFGIRETWSIDHELYCAPALFAQFVCALELASRFRLLERMQPTMVDLNKLTRRTIIKYRGMAYDDCEEINR